MIKSYFVEGMHDMSHLFWRHQVRIWHHGQSASLTIEDDLDVHIISHM